MYSVVHTYITLYVKIKTESKRKTLVKTGKSIAQLVTLRTSYIRIFISLIVIIFSSFFGETKKFCEQETNLPRTLETSVEKE